MAPTVPRIASSTGRFSYLDGASGVYLMPALVVTAKRPPAKPPGYEARLMDQHLNRHQPVKADPTDLRDHFYRPALLRLDPELLPPAFIEDFAVRDQGNTGHCTGYALAHLIDLHRHLSHEASSAQRAKPDEVSASMLYYMGRRQELPEHVGGVSLEDGVHSVRSVIKGFYHYGVCRERSWSSTGEGVAEPLEVADLELTPERAKEAKGITLGAYYRIRPYLNDYHAALTEAQAILVSAEIHTGWHQDRISSPASGEIVPHEEWRGGHAFVIIGYTDRGFLVLNSWGSDWGRWNGLPGVALWTYEDWADRVLDAWVLRLGVPSPEAFAHSNRPTGISFDVGPIQGPSSACHQLLGHYAHLDDGRHVERGSYASTRRSVEMTAERLAGKGSTDDRQQIVLSIPGSLLDLKRAFAFEVARKPKLRSRGLYPYTLFWCNDVMETATAVLWRLFDEAIERVGLTSPNRDAMIEETCSGIGRAFWRDVRYGAEVAAAYGPHVSSDGHAAHLFDAFARIDQAEIHLVVDGAGSILLSEYLRNLTDDRAPERVVEARERFFARVGSLNLIAPTIDFERFAADLGPLIRSVTSRGEDRFTLVLPGEELEQRLSVGVYEKSILDLVMRSFEGRRSDQDGLVGMGYHRWPATHERKLVDELIPNGRIHHLEVPDGAQDRRRLDQSQVNYHEHGLHDVMETVARLAVASTTRGPFGPVIEGRH